MNNTTRILPRLRPVIVLTALMSFFMLTAIAATAQSVARVTCDAKAGFSDIVEGNNYDFCVYYNEANPSNYTNGTLTEAEAEEARDHTDDYWAQYNSFGFRDAKFSDALEVLLIQGSTGGNCNGSSGHSRNDYDMWTGCYNWNGIVQSTVGHELFHRVQYSYDGVESKWFKEGTARMMEDNTFANMDNRANAMTIPFSFNLEVNDYLASTNSDVTSIGMRYESALWWKYFAEQYGSITTEPQRGVDAIVALWEAADGLDDIAALNSALNTLGAGVDFDTAFRRFTVANWAKKMIGQPDGSYNYIDEDDPNNPAVYGPIMPQQDGTGQISNGNPDTFLGQSIGRYGARYFRAVPQSAASCPVVSVSFEDAATSGTHGSAFYHAITTRNANTFGDHREAIGGDFDASFMNNNITEVVAIVGGLDDPARADVTFSCSTPLIDIIMPNNVAVANVGPFDLPGKFLAQINVVDAEKGAPIAGLRSTDFSATVGGDNAIITTGSFVQDQYWLIIQAPPQAGDGTYDLEVTLSYSGGSVSDSNADSVRYDNLNTDQVLVIDRSGSMGSSSKMEAAIDAGAFYADITRDGDGLSVVPFSGDVVNPVFDMQVVDFGVRAGAIGYLSSLTPLNATSIGDGLEEAIAQFGSSPTGNTRCSIVLLSDGMETAPQYWADVQGDVITKGCPVTTIAFGPEADETLMQSIATATGGANYYNDVSLGSRSASAISDNNLDLADIYENAQAEAKDRQRLMRQQGNAPIDTSGRGIGIRHPVLLDKTLQEVMLALDWYSPFTFQEKMVELWLELPDGTIVKPSDKPYDFEDYDSGHLGWYWKVEEAGLYHLIVVNSGGDSPDKDGLPYQVFASARSRLTMQLLLPAVQTVRVTGEQVPIIVFLSDERPITDADVTAIITAPDGSENTLQLFDDGLHGDGAADDGTYGNWYTALNQAETHGPVGEDCIGKCPDAKDEGSYQVRARAVKAGEFEREVLGSFSILESADNNDNRLPDAFEERYGLVKADDDNDKDKLTNLQEYEAGTDPTNSDTDGGGESDYSEVIFGRDPLDPSDDQIAAPAFFTAEAGNNFVDIYYDAHPTHAGYQLMRAESPDGPWSPANVDLDGSGKATLSVENNVPVYLCLQAFGSKEEESRILFSELVIPRVDPVLPEANMTVIGLPKSNIVTLIFSAQEETEAFEDIRMVRFSNVPFNDEAVARAADWEDFDPDGMTWEIDPNLVNESGYVQVYAQFMDDAGNISEGSETAAAPLAPPTAVQLQEVTALPLAMNTLLLIAAAVGLTLLPILRLRRR